MKAKRAIFAAIAILAIAGYTPGLSQSLAAMDTLKLDFPKATLADLKQFELVFPLAAEFATGGNTASRFFIPIAALGVNINRFQLGVRLAAWDLENPKGSASGFLIYHWPRKSDRQAFYFGSQLGASFESHSENLRLGAILGWFTMIGTTNYPGTVRVQLAPFLDIQNSERAFGFSLNAGIGLPLGRAVK